MTPTRPKCLFFSCFHFISNRPEAENSAICKDKRALALVFVELSVVAGAHAPHLWPPRIARVLLLVLLHQDGVDGGGQDDLEEEEDEGEEDEEASHPVFFSFLEGVVKILKVNF